MIIIINEHIRLEETAPQHAVGLLEAVNANREHLARFLPWVGAMQTTADFDGYITQCRQRAEQGTEISFVIYRDDVIAGRIGLHYINAANKTGAIGYWLTQAAAGHGIMLNSCRKVIEFGFTVLQLHRIEIKAAVHNVKSQAVPEKLGFTREGILRESEWVNGEAFNIVVYSLLKREWEAQQANSKDC